MKTTNQLQRIVRQAERTTQRTIKQLLSGLRHIEREMAEVAKPYHAAASEIRKHLSVLGHNGPATGRRRGRPPGSASAATPKQSGGKKKRIRRSPGQLRTEAADVLKFINDAGKEGALGRDIRKRWPGVGQDIKTYVNKWTGKKLRTSGSKSTMRYLAA